VTADVLVSAEAVVGAADVLVSAEAVVGAAGVLVSAEAAGTVATAPSVASWRGRHE
jgi:hypothetical protein